MKTDDLQTKKAINDNNMRVIITKRMLREGLLRCLKHTDIEKISISELCRESQINRATFYNHYETPKDILLEMGWEYAHSVKDLLNSNPKLNLKERIVKCISVLHENKDQIKVLISASADKSMMDVTAEMFSWIFSNIVDIKNALGLKDDIECDLVYTSFGWASYHLLRKWIKDDLNKTPEEIAEVLLKALSVNKYGDKLIIS